jgi:hypothetical protein
MPGSPEHRYTIARNKKSMLTGSTGRNFTKGECATARISLIKNKPLSYIIHRHSRIKFVNLWNPFNVITASMDPKKSIEVLEGQIRKLEEKEFDLNAWKNFTVLLLERIFGRQSKKIEAIQKIKYDMGSWVLRDETGYTNSMEACKKLGREVLEEAIVELETFGLPEESPNTIPFDTILTALKDELTGTQFREIKKAVSDKGAIEDRKKILNTKLQGYGSDAAWAIVANILSDEEIASRLKDLD